ncbi:MAG: hypothetical protein FJ090_00015 [Deltaproteobacteria bacterium]|nr:hypothetical protein [Deltaproteobacteria bacterium]
MPRPPVDQKLAPFKDKLGKIPDHEIAAQAGVSRTAVVSFRKRMGIKSYEGYKFQPGAAPAKAASAAKSAGSKSASTKAPASKPAAAKAGPAKPTPARAAPQKAPASKPAAADVKPTPVAAPKVAAAPAAPAAKAFHGRKSKLDPYVHLLGKLPDAEIATRAGVTTENVRAYRSRRGINPSKPNAPAKAAPVAPAAPARVETKAARAHAASAPAAAARVTAGGKPSAFTVTADGKAGEVVTYAVVASDIAEAARLAIAGLAARGSTGAIRGIQRVAELL